MRLFNSVRGWQTFLYTKMKRKLIFNLIALFVLSTTLVSCGKDDDSDDSFTLNGKVYAAYGYQGGGVSSGGYTLTSYDAYWVVRFTSDTHFEYTARKNSPNGGIIGDIETGTYTLSYPKLVLSFENRKYGDKEMDATFINESTFRVISGSDKVLEYNLQ